MLTIAAGMSGRTPFRSPLDRRDEAGACKRTFDWGNSDHLALVKVGQLATLPPCYSSTDVPFVGMIPQAYNLWRDQGRQGDQRKLCDNNFLSHETMRTISDLRRDYANVLADIGFLPGRASGRNRDDYGYVGERTEELNVCSENVSVLQAALVGGLYPNLIKVKIPSKYTEVAGGAVRVTLKRAARACGVMVLSTI